MGLGATKSTGHIHASSLTRWFFLLLLKLPQALSPICSTKKFMIMLTHIFLVALTRYQSIIDNPESGEIDYDEVEPGITKPTKAAIRVNDLLETVTGVFRV